MSSVSDVVAQLAERSTHDLRLEWRRYHRGDTPDCLSRDLLIRSLAYKLQEQAHGGLSQSAKRALRASGQKIHDVRADAPVADVTLKPGVRLVREWRGEAHIVLVLQDGFEYRDARYRSLTQIARHITGAHWSGPRFFGLGAAAANVRSVRQSPLSDNADVDGAHGQA